MANNFDPELEFPAGFTWIRGTAGTIEVIDPIAPAPPFVKNFVLDRTEAFKLRVSWKLEGFLVPVWLAALDDGATQWNVKVFAESIGPGQEIQIATANVPVGPHVNPANYSVDLTVAANTLEESNPGDPNRSGIYRLTACIFLNSNLGEPGYDIVGFAEGPTIMIEDPV